MANLYRTGTAGADTLIGGAGNDTLEGGLGSDVLNGSAGSDTASYANAAVGVTLDRQTPANSLGEAAGDTFIAIESFLLTAHDDAFFGIDAAERIDGGAGNDRLTGGAGNDVLLGGIGADTLDGGLGNDALTGGVGDDVYVFDAKTDKAVEAAGQGFDEIRSAAIALSLVAMPNIEAIALLGTLDLAATGNAGANRLAGNAGRNLIAGLAGTDTLTGGSGDDTLVGGAGADLLDGGDGAADVASYRDAKLAVTIDLASLAHTGDALGDVFAGIEVFELSNKADRFFGSADGNAAIGGAGNDTLQGNGGGDTLEGGAGADLLDGGDGEDIASYRSAALAVTLNRATPALSKGDAAGDRFVSIEAFELSTRNDLLIGSTGDDRADGGAGNDTLIGGIGADTLQGGLGGDVLIGGAGTDLLDGGEGFDIASYATASPGLRLDLADSLASTGDANGDTFIAIERFLLTSGNDTLAGSSAGNDVGGGAGNDSLLGGAGEDTLDGGAGADTLEGGSDTDWASYGSAAKGVTVDLANPLASTGEAAGDVYLTIEGFLLSPFADVFRANALIRTVDGGGGNDKLLGADAMDRFSGGAGNDSLSGAGDSDVLAGDAGNDTLVGGDGFDLLEGGVGNDRLDGGADNDWLDGGQGADALIGGLGEDTASYASATAAVRVDLLDAKQRLGDAKGDTYSGIERYLLTDHGDTFLGSNGAETVDGGLGDDTLTGRLGDDMFSSAAGTGTDVVADFGDAPGNEDRIDLTSFGFGDFSGLVASGAMTATARGVEIDLGGGNRIVLQAMALASLDDGDFFFG